MTLATMQEKVTAFIEEFRGDDHMCPTAFGEFLKAAVGLPSRIVSQTVLFGVAPVVTLDTGEIVLLGPPADVVGLFLADFYAWADFDEDDIDDFKQEAHERTFRPLPDITEYLGLEREAN